MSSYENAKLVAPVKGTIHAQAARTALRQAQEELVSIPVTYGHNGTKDDLSAARDAVNRALDLVDAIQARAKRDARERGVSV